MKVTRHLPSILWVSLGAAILAVAFALASGSASIVSAVPPSDDCTGVADEGPNFNFHAACQAHDACYATYGGGQRSAIKEAARAACDNAFLANMNAWCTQALQNHTITQVGASACRSRAVVYYNGVRLLGGLFFYNNQTPI